MCYLGDSFVCAQFKVWECSSVGEDCLACTRLEILCLALQKTLKRNMQFISAYSALLLERVQSPVVAVVYKGYVSP